jgi:exodeoxyribonuclease VII large subunit
MQKDKIRIYTVSQVNSLIKGILDNNLPGRLTITGEITDWKLHHSGHCYFSLKDEDSNLPCVMWKSSFAKLKFQPENGLAVLGAGFVDVYVPHGRYQFIVDKLTPAGVGALQLAFEQMVKKLQAEGLFDEEHKKPLPEYPERIGILTSESGAAIEDIKDSIWNRWPCVKLFLYPVPVQGEGAAEEIAAGLRDINRRNKELKLDVLIVGRGGGSLEDLWAFNEEVLARAIFDSKIPVISAVGHEIDTTVADLVADARASTPTKAGVVAVPDMQKVLSDLENYQSSLYNNIALCLNYRQQQLDEMAGNIADAVKQFLAERRERLYRSYEQITKIEPHRLLGRMTVDLNNLNNRVSTAIQAIINKRRMALTAQANLLTGLDPKSVLKRGYSITTNKQTGLLVRKPDDVQIGDLLTTELAEEKLIESKVTLTGTDVDTD